MFVCVQSLEALVNRVVWEVTKDRPEGVAGYLTSQLLARLRKVSLSLIYEGIRNLL